MPNSRLLKLRDFATSKIDSQSYVVDFYDQKSVPFESSTFIAREVSPRLSEVTTYSTKGLFFIGLHPKEITPPLEPMRMVLIPDEPLYFLEFGKGAVLVEKLTELRPTGKWSLFNGERTTAARVTMVLI